jgi:hypothetical protein
VMSAPAQNVTRNTKKPIKRAPSSGRGLIRISAAACDAIDNPETISEWTDEELRRGRKKDKNGKFTGRDPIIVPTNCYREMVRRELRRAESSMAENLHDAVKALATIATSPMSEDRDKIAATKILMDRVMGKSPDKIELGGKTPLFIGILQGGIVPGEPLEVPAGDFIDVESEEVDWEG